MRMTIVGAKNAMRGRKHDLDVEDRKTGDTLKVTGKKEGTQ